MRSRSRQARWACAAAVRRWGSARAGCAATVGELSRDPALRLTEVGRALLRALSVQALLAEDPGRLAAAVPPHLRASVAAVAHRAGRTWQEFGALLENASDADTADEKAVRRRSR